MLMDTGTLIGETSLQTGTRQGSAGEWGFQALEIWDRPTSGHFSPRSEG
ncbi:hypothetical protein [Prochlorothrix hollandica]|nr:hypothetical protein [Prochlorothrix hollandica]